MVCLYNCHCAAGQKRLVQVQESGAITAACSRHWAGLFTWIFKERTLKSESMSCTTLLMPSCRYGKYLAKGGHTAHLIEQVGFVLVCGRKKGSDKAGCELYCENPSCQDILCTHRNKTYTHIHTEQHGRQQHFQLLLYIMLSHCLLSTGLTSWPRLPVTSKDIKCTDCPVSSPPEALR